MIREKCKKYRGELNMPLSNIGSFKKSINSDSDTDDLRVVVDLLVQAFPKCGLPFVVLSYNRRYRVSHET